MFKQIQNILRFKSHVQRYKFTTQFIQDKINHLSPYSFEGYIVPHEYSNLEEAQQRAHFVNILDENLYNGFIFGYNNIIDAYQNQDSDFFKNLCEPRLFKKIDKWFDFQTDNNLKSIIVNEDADIDQLLVMQFNLIFGVKQVRDENYNIKNLKKSVLQLPTTNLIFYQIASNQQKLAGINTDQKQESFKINNMMSLMQLMLSKQLNIENLQQTRPLMQVEVFLKSKKHLIIEDHNQLREKDVSSSKGGQRIFNNDNNNFIHQIVYEAECKDIFGQPNSVHQIMGFLNKALMSSLKPNNQQQMGQYLKDFLLGDDYCWKVVDFDNFCKGNQFDQD